MLQEVERIFDKISEIKVSVDHTVDVKKIFEVSERSV